MNKTQARISMGQDIEMRINDHSTGGLYTKTPLEIMYFIKNMKGKQNNKTAAFPRRAMRLDENMKKEKGEKQKEKRK